jgi:glycosyltransferase involved in cell wall biosynthesis
MDRLTLLALTTSYPLRAHSSAGVFIARLYQALPPVWSVDVLCPSDNAADSDARPERDVDAGSRVRLRPLRYAPRRWRVVAQQSGGVVSGLKRAPWRLLLLPLLFGAMAWRALLGARRADLIHANWAICGAIAAPVARISRRPLVTTFRGDDVVRAERSRVDRWLLQLAVRGSRAIVCVSAAMADDLRRLYPERAGDIHVCLNGVDAGFSAQAGLRVPGRKLRIAGVGSLIPRKGFDVLLQALARLPPSLEWELCVVGAGPEGERLVQLAESLGIAERVRWAGALPPAEIPGVLGKADLFVLASHSEGRPNALIEAIAAGLPVISTALPGVAGLVDAGVSGWLVASGDIAGLHEALLQACGDRAELARRAAATRQRLPRACHDWATTGRCYDAAFRAVLAACRKSSS